jgi:hypothetical protein
METACISLLCHWSIFSSKKIRQKCFTHPEGLPYLSALSVIDFLQWKNRQKCDCLTDLEGLHGDSLQISALSLVDFLQGKNPPKMRKSYPSGRTPWRRPPLLCVAWRSGSLDCWSRWRESSILELHPIDNNTKLRQDTSKHRKLDIFFFAVAICLKYRWNQGWGVGYGIRIHIVFRIRICITFRIHIHIPPAVSGSISAPFARSGSASVPDTDPRHILDPDQHLPWTRNWYKRKLQPL